MRGSLTNADTHSHSDADANSDTHANSDSDANTVRDRPARRQL
jgi:hypothetical protein